MLVMNNHDALCWARENNRFEIGNKQNLSFLASLLRDYWVFPQFNSGCIVLILHLKTEINTVSGKLFWRTKFLYESSLVIAMTSDDPNRVQATETSFAILETLLEESGATLARLDEQLPMSKTTIYHHLETLHESGYVDRSDGTYSLGIGLLTLGGKCRDSLLLYQNGRQFVDRVAEDTEEFVALTTRHQTDSVHIYRAEGEQALPTDSYLGIRYKLHSCASGRAMLAMLSDAEIENYLDKVELRQLTGETITDPGELKQELETIRERSVALVDGERIKGLRSIAAPITNRTTGEPLGALAIAGAKGTLTDDRFFDEIPSLILGHAETLELQIEFS